MGLRRHDVGHRFPRSLAAIVNATAVVTTMLAVTAVMSGCGRGEERWAAIPVSPSLEDRTTSGDLFTPSTQSLLRGYHWLDTVEAIDIVVQDHAEGEIHFTSHDPSHELRVCNVPLDQLVPRLHYEPASPPDAFDAFNLMLAEYARNSISMPVGKPGDETAHFETDLLESVPWDLRGDYDFVPNPVVRPVRVSVINNCLDPGLWELSAVDPSGEIHHSWFDMPEDLYCRLVADTNDVPETFARNATAWSAEPVPLYLDRLRSMKQSIGPTPLALTGDAASGYSTQDSRRKLSKGYVLVEHDDDLRIPERLSDLTTRPCQLSSFVRPGKYSSTERNRFELGFLRRTKVAEVARVTPRTSYRWRAEPSRTDESQRSRGDYLELTILLEDRRLVLGNLPLELLVPQSDFAINGFGVGILSSGGVAERRKYLIEAGPAPSFAYLCREESGQLIGLNSHELGLEQIFLRTHLEGDRPWWEITVTSYERMVDLVKYSVEIPPVLHDEVHRYALEYIAPLYLTYRDDNLR